MYELMKHDLLPLLLSTVADRNKEYIIKFFIVFSFILEISLQKDRMLNKMWLSLA